VPGPQPFCVRAATQPRDFALPIVRSIPRFAFAATAVARRPAARGADSTIRGPTGTTTRPLTGKKDEGGRRPAIFTAANRPAGGLVSIWVLHVKHQKTIRSQPEVAAGGG
jgi:hypothetical protein